MFLNEVTTTVAGEDAVALYESIVNSTTRSFRAAVIYLAPYAMSSYSHGLVHVAADATANPVQLAMLRIYECFEILPFHLSCRRRSCFCNMQHTGGNAALE